VGHAAVRVATFAVQWRVLAVICRITHEELAIIPDVISAVERLALHRFSPLDCVLASRDSAGRRWVWTKGRRIRLARPRRTSLYHCHSEDAVRFNAYLQFITNAPLLPYLAAAHHRDLVTLDLVTLDLVMSDIVAYVVHLQTGDQQGHR